MVSAKRQMTATVTLVIQEIPVTLLNVMGKQIKTEHAVVMVTVRHLIPVLAILDTLDSKYQPERFSRKTYC